MVGETGDVAGAGAMAVALAAEVVLLALRLDPASRVPAVRELARAAPAARVVVLSDGGPGEDPVALAEAGAVGQLHRDAPLPSVGAAVRAVAAGHVLLSPAAAAAVVEEVRALRRPVAPAAPEGHGLTCREREVLALLAAAQSNRVIARRLCISENTVKNHVRHILEKLDLESRSQAVVYALRPDLLTGRSERAVREPGAP